MFLITNLNPNVPENSNCSRKILQRIQGSEMRLRSLDTEQQVSKSLLSCAKSSAASQGFFLWESPLERISPSKRLLLSLCSQGCSCCAPHETQQPAPPTRGCWSWLLSREYGWAGSILSRVTPIPLPTPSALAPLGRLARQEGGGSLALHQHAQGREAAAGQEER